MILLDFDKIDFSVKKYDETRKYYVYEWYNVETGAVFYVGKGSGGRYKRVTNSSRNIYFLRYYNKHKCDSRILFCGLTEEEAYLKEKEIIIKYNKLGYQLTNCDEGGHLGGANSGEKNGMYGKTHTPEVRKILRDVNLGKTGKTNSNAKYCDVYDDKFEFIKHFDCITDAMNYIGEIENRTYKSMVTYFWRYQNGIIDIILNKYHIKIYRKSEEDNDVPSVSKNRNEGSTTIESV